MYTQWTESGLRTLGAELDELPFQLFDLEDYIWYQALLPCNSSNWLRCLAVKLGRLLDALDEVIDLVRQRLFHCIGRVS